MEDARSKAAEVAFETAKIFLSDGLINGFLLEGSHDDVHAFFRFKPDLSFRVVGGEIVSAVDLHLQIGCSSVLTDQMLLMGRFMDTGRLLAVRARPDAPPVGFESDAAVGFLWEEKRTSWDAAAVYADVYNALEQS